MKRGLPIVADGRKGSFFQEGPRRGRERVADQHVRRRHPRRCRPAGVIKATSRTTASPCIAACRTGSRPCCAPSRPCVRAVRSCPAFPLAPALRSGDCAAGSPPCSPASPLSGRRRIRENRSHGSVRGRAMMRVPTATRKEMKGNANPFLSFSGEERLQVRGGVLQIPSREVRTKAVSRSALSLRAAGRRDDLPRAVILLFVERSPQRPALRVAAWPAFWQEAAHKGGANARTHVRG